MDRASPQCRGEAIDRVCTASQLVDGDVVAIDWQLSGWCAVGFDVGQLIAGHAQSGDLDPAQFDAAYTAAIEEYTGGLYDEGVDLAADDVALGAAGVTPPRGCPSSEVVLGAVPAWASA